MLARRHHPCLDVANGRVVKGVHFESLRDAGDPVEQGAHYDAEGADELVFLDIAASHEIARTTLDMVSRVADRLFIPFTVGGGIRPVEDAGRRSAPAPTRWRSTPRRCATPTWSRRLADSFGTPVRGGGGGQPAGRGRATSVMVTGGREPTGRSMRWSGRRSSSSSARARSCSPRWTGTARRRAMTSRSRAAVSAAVRIPVIASGGAGKLEDLADALRAGAHGVLAASIFHFRGSSLPEARAYLAARGFPVRP